MSNNFWCENRLKHEHCELCDNKGNVVSYEEQEFCLNSSDHNLKYMGHNSIFSVAEDKLINNKSKRDKFQKSRKKRASKHFEDEVLPGLSGAERQHFIKKRGFKS